MFVFPYIYICKYMCIYICISNPQCPNPPNRYKHLCALHLLLSGYDKPFIDSLNKAAVTAAKAAGSAPPVIVEGKATLKQTGIAEDQLRLSSGSIFNQLEKAAIFFNDINNYHKCQIPSIILRSVALLHSEQAKTLRSLDHVIPFELKYLCSTVHDAPRVVMAELTTQKHYEKFGLTTEWRSGSTFALQDAIVETNNDRATLVWDVVMSTVLDAEWRSLEWLGGHTRRITLLLHSDPVVVDKYIEELKQDWINYQELDELQATWSIAMCDRSLFVARCVLQVVLLLQLDGWTFTARLSHIQMEILIVPYINIYIYIHIHWEKTTYIWKRQHIFEKKKMFERDDNNNQQPSIYIYIYTYKLYPQVHVYIYIFVFPYIYIYV